MGEKWRPFPWGTRGPLVIWPRHCCWVAFAGYLCSDLATRGPFVPKISRGPGASGLLPPTQAAALCRKPACTMPLRFLLISAPPVLLPRLALPCSPSAFPSWLWLEGGRVTLWKGSQAAWHQTPSLVLSPRSFTLSKPPSSIAR